MTDTDDSEQSEPNPRPTPATDHPAAGRADNVRALPVRPPAAAGQQRNRLLSSVPLRSPSEPAQFPTRPLKPSPPLEAPRTVQARSDATEPTEDSAAPTSVPASAWMSVPDPSSLAPSTDETANPGIANMPDTRKLLAYYGRIRPESLSDSDAGPMVKPGMPQERDERLFIAHRPRTIVHIRDRGAVTADGTRLSRQGMVVAEVLLAFGAVTYDELKLATGFPDGSLRNKIRELTAADLILKDPGALESRTVFGVNQRLRRLLQFHLSPTVLSASLVSDVHAANAVLTHLDLPGGSTVLTGWEILDRIAPVPQVPTEALVWVAPSGARRRPDAVVYQLIGETIWWRSLYVYLDTTDGDEHRQFCEELLRRMPGVHLVILSADPGVLDHQRWWPEAATDARVRTIHHTYPARRRHAW